MTFLHSEHQYLDGLDKCLVQQQLDRTPKEDRTGTGTYGIFGDQWRFWLPDGFPLLTTKKLNFRAIVAELLWMLSGDTNVKTLQDQNVHIWDEWADENGNLGPVYGQQWRAWPGVPEYVPGCGTLIPVIDQIEQAIETLKTNPTSRRIVVSAWNVADLKHMALAPCHCLFQFYVDKQNRLSCQLYQRSADIMLGVPYNIASYALLTHLMARECGLEVGSFIHTFGDLHLYANHVEAANQQVHRNPYPFPRLILPAEWPGIFNLKVEDIGLGDYQAHPHIKAEVSI